MHARRRSRSQLTPRLLPLFAYGASLTSLTAEVKTYMKRNENSWLDAPIIAATKPPIKRFLAVPWMALKDTEQRYGAARREPRQTGASVPTAAAEVIWSSPGVRVPDALDPKQLFLDERAVVEGFAANVRRRAVTEHEQHLVGHIAGNRDQLRGRAEGVDHTQVGDDASNNCETAGGA